ncbi:MAG TPA: hypothetical protein VGB98_09030 [Pyrinomonadaceae bacterium]|jgi:hypothetical protein
MKFWRLRDDHGDPLYIDPADISAVYLSGPEEKSDAPAGQVRVALKGSSGYFALDDASGLQVLEHFEGTSVAPGDS